MQSEELPGVDPRLTRTLYELSTSAGRSLDALDLLQQVAEHASALLHGDAVAVYLWDDAAALLRPVYSNDVRQPSEDHPLRAGQGAAGQALQRRESVVVDDYQRWEHAVPWGLERGLKSVESVPLLFGDQPIGALVIRFYSERAHAGADEQRIFELIAAQAAPALVAARLYASWTLEREHERALREITSALAENLDERHVLELAVHYSAQLFGAPYSRVWLFEPNGELSCAAAEGYISEYTFTDRLANDSVSGHAARRPIVNLANAPAESGWRFNREFGERTGLGAYLGAGLWRAGQSLGVLEVMRRTGHRFSDVEEQLLASLANTVAVAVSNARTHAAAEHLAREAEHRAEALAESERVLRSVYEAIGSGVLVINPQGQVVNANTAAEAILGVPASRLLGGRPGVLDLEEHADGRIGPVTELPAARAIRTRSEHRRLLFSFKRPDGRRRWLQLDAVPLLGADGDVTSVVSSFIDITEQRESDEALRRRDAILQAVAFAAENLLSTPEWQQSIEDVLPQLGAATGVSRVYVVPAGDAGPEHGDTYHEWTAEGIASRAESVWDGSYLSNVGLGRWEQVLREGGIVQGALREFPPDEQIMLAAQGVCSLVVVPIFVGSTWWGFIGFDDCAEERRWPASAVEVLKTAATTLGAAMLRRRAEAARLQLVSEQAARVEAEAAQRRLAFLAEASRILAGSLDYEDSLPGVVELVVPGLADGCLVDVLDGDGSIRRVASKLAIEFPEDVLAELPVIDVIATNQPWQEQRALSVPLVAHAEPSGAFTWLASPARQPFDATDLDLAQHIARRCALAIENSRLYHEARAAVSIRDEFLSVAAHELKTPMTSLRGYAQLLARELERGQVSHPERARRAATTIQIQSDKLARLVAQLLDVSRLQSGKLIVEPRPTDLTDLIREIVEQARTQLKDHTIVARLPGELWVSIDPLRIEQVITNLIDNAIKYSPEGGRIDVGLRCDQATETASVVVRDRGVGVPAEHRAHIFDRFYQAHAGGPLTSMAGMGLGLYISRQIVELHGGSIEAEFPDDGGTRFVVTLPVA